MGQSSNRCRTAKDCECYCLNLWQMDGISGTIPFGKPKEEYHQFSLFDFVVADEPKAGYEDRKKCTAGFMTGAAISR